MCRSHYGDAAYRQVVLSDLSKAVNDDDFSACIHSLSSKKNHHDDDDMAPRHEKKQLPSFSSLLLRHELLKIQPYFEKKKKWRCTCDPTLLIIFNPDPCAIAVRRVHTHCRYAPKAARVEGTDDSL